jgi:hypothetical protein
LRIDASGANNEVIMLIQQIVPQSLLLLVLVQAKQEQ